MKGIKHYFFNFKINVYSGLFSLNRLVRLSLLTMTNPNQLCDVLLFVCRWLIRPILALNCLLQIEQERSEEESSVGDALALAFRCARLR